MLRLSIGLVPAAENPQGFAFRLSCFLRLWVGGLSRRLLSNIYDLYNEGSGPGFRKTLWEGEMRIARIAIGFRVQGCFQTYSPP